MRCLDLPVPASCRGPVEGEVDGGTVAGAAADVKINFRKIIIGKSKGCVSYYFLLTVLSRVGAANDGDRAAVGRLQKNKDESM